MRVVDYLPFNHSLVISPSSTSSPQYKRSFSPHKHSQPLTSTQHPNLKPRARNRLLATASQRVNQTTSNTTMVKQASNPKSSSESSNPKHVSKRPRLGDTRKDPMLVPIRQNSIFEHFNRDIRNMIYGYMAFPPVFGPGIKDAVSFMKTCSLAYQEGKEEGARQAWLLVQEVSGTWTDCTRHTLTSCLHNFRCRTSSRGDNTCPIHLQYRRPLLPGSANP